MTNKFTNGGTVPPFTATRSWRSGDDLHALMKAMDKVKYNGKALTYWVWYVPCEDKTPYEINFYQPQVEGAFILAEVNPAEKKRKVNQ